MVEGEAGEGNGRGSGYWMGRRRDSLRRSSLLRQEATPAQKARACSRTSTIVRMVLLMPSPPMWERSEPASEGGSYKNSDPPSRRLAFPGKAGGANAPSTAA